MVGVFGESLGGGEGYADATGVCVGIDGVGRVVGLRRRSLRRADQSVIGP